MALTKPIRIKYFFISLLSLVVFSVSMLGAGIWYLNSSDYLERWIEDKLSQPDNQVKVRISDAQIALSFSEYPISISTTDVNVTVPQQMISLPKAQFDFDLFDLLADEPIPRSITLDQIAFTMEYDVNGWHTGESFAALVNVFSPSNINLNSINSSNLDPDNQEATHTDQAVSRQYFPIEKLAINNGKVTILYPSSEADDANLSLEIDGIMIDIENNGDVIQTNAVISHPELGDAQLNGRISPDLNNWDITAILNRFDSGLFYPYLGVNIPELHDLGLISGNVQLIVSDQQVNVLSGDIDAINGQIIVPAIGVLDFTTAASEFHYDKSVDRLLLTSLDINAAKSSAISGQLSLRGELRETSTSSPLFIASLKGSDIPLQPVLALMPDNEWLEHAEHGRMLRGGKIDHLELETIAVIRRDEDRLLFQTFAVTSTVRNIKFISGYGPVDRLAGILDGQFNFVLDGEGQINRADTHLLLRESSILPKQGSKIIPLNGLEFIAKLNGPSLEIERLAIDAKIYGQLALRGKLTIDNQFKPSVFETQIQAEQLDNELVFNLWPEQLFPKTRSWMNANLSGGQVTSFYLNTGFDLKGDDLKPLFIEGTGNATVSRFEFLRGHEPIVNSEIGISFAGTKLSGTTFELDFNKGSVHGLDLKGSTLTIIRKDESVDAALALLARGDVTDVVRMLDEPRFNFITANGLEQNTMAGMADITGSIKWQIPQTKRVMNTDEFDVKISASVENAAFSNLPGGYALSKGAVNLQFNNGDIRVNGQGRIDDALANFYFHKDKQKNNTVDVTFSKSEAFTSILNRSFPLDLGGVIGGQIYISDRHEDAGIDLNVNLDMGDAHFYIPRLELTKLEGERAMASAQIRMVDGIPQDIRNIVVDADVIRMEGDISFAKGGTFSEANLSAMEWPGNILSKAVFKRHEDGSFSLSADAEVMDLRPLRLKESPGEGLEMTLDLSAERLILDHRLSVAGSVVIETRKDGSGKAKFLGSMFVKDRPFMTEATMDADFGENSDAMVASGLIGGVEVALNLDSGLAEGDRLILTTQNAGQVLKTLDVTDAIRGGEMTMHVLYQPDDAENYVAEFSLTEFRVIEAPRAIRMLSVLSLAGLYSLVEGDGTAFNEGQARIVVTPDFQNLDTVKARGDALALELTGQINRKDDDLNISGVLVPINLVTELLGHVPIVGEIVTGINNEGIFNTRFRMRGVIEDPDIEVRLSSIAPGLLRDIFSPDWIINERSRLLNEQEQQVQEQ